MSVAPGKYPTASTGTNAGAVVSSGCSLAEEKCQVTVSMFQILSVLTVLHVC